MPKEIPKAFEPKQVEDSLYREWETSGLFRPSDPNTRMHPNDPNKKPFSIAMPPPNATGTLHLGHAVMLAIEDIMTRYARMNNRPTLWLPGTDHASIATENKVEKNLLEKSKTTKQELGRTKFLKEVEKFVSQSQDIIKTQVRKMGASCDWSRERYTLDAGLSRCVQEVFVKMYNDGLIYRGHRIVNWCTRCQSTLADDEVEYKEQYGKFYYLKYGPVTIGTARPETKVLDKVIIVHPNDKRYKKFVGKTLDVPWIDGTVKATFVADKAADMKMGSGAMTITPAHSFVDFALAQKYGFEIKQIIGPDGKLTANGGKFAGMDVVKARAAIIAELKKKGLVEKIDENYVHNLSVCYRCDTPVEPLVSEQWFVNVDKPARTWKGKKRSLKEIGIDAVKSGDIKILPDKFNKTYFQWMENLHDWCISRQIWFGHRIPVWYCGELSKTIKKMGFAGDIVTQVFDSKTRTYRLRDHGFTVGEKVAFEDSSTKKIFGYGNITEVKKTTVGQIDLNDAKHWKTYKKREELIAAFKRHHPEKDVNDKTPAWVYTYEFDKKIPKQNCGMTIVSAVAPSSCPTCGNKKLIQDPDTLDTWFSSALWTFSTLLDKPQANDTLDSWLARNKQPGKDLQMFHPTSVMETGYDILFFWVARMILMTTYVLGEVPFKTVYLHGLVRDKAGRKMSKSLGNGIDPLDMITDYGADATRLALVIGTAPGNDTRLYEEKIAGYRNFVNKIWNIARFILTRPPQNHPPAPSLVKEGGHVVVPPPVPRRGLGGGSASTLADQWIQSRLQNLIHDVTDHFEKYEFSPAGEKIYDFLWHELADWYVEISKTQDHTLAPQILLDAIKLLHPFTPFVTEHIFQLLKQSGLIDSKDKFLATSAWPKRDAPTGPSLQDKKIENDFAIIQELVTTLRDLRSTHNLPYSEKLDAAITTKNYKDLFQEQELVIEALTKIRIQVLPTKPVNQEDFIREHKNDFDIYLKLSRQTITEQEKRITKERISLEQYIKSLEAKLANKNFLKNAPKEVVEKEKVKLKQAKEKSEKLQ